MRFSSRKRDRHARLVRDGDRPAGGASGYRRFDTPRELLDTPRELRRAASSLKPFAGLPRSGEATVDARAWLDVALETLASASAMIRDAAATGSADATALAPDDLERLGLLLFSIDQNLRFAAHACELARESLAPPEDQP